MGSEVGALIVWQLLSGPLAPVRKFELPGKSYKETRKL